MKHETPTALVILDGFGHSDEQRYNAIAQAHTPNLDTWYKQYPHVLLEAAGKAVGLLEGYASNSEVGHLTIGSGRIIEQPMSMVHNAIVDGSFFSNGTLRACLERIRVTGTALHIMGLVSDAGIHSHSELLYAVLDAAYRHEVGKVFVHAFLDGRDVAPKSALIYLELVEQACARYECGTLASIHGRFYAMDRGNRWDRIERSYRVMVYGDNHSVVSWRDVIQDQYSRGITDEFIEPTLLDTAGTIKEGDGIFFLNVREDRARELTAAFVDPKFHSFRVEKLLLSFFITPICYASYLKTDALFCPKPLDDTLLDVLAANHRTIFAIAETEKYAHISYFFSGKRERTVQGETRVLIPSITTKNYVNYPCMSAPEITAAVCASLRENPHDFYLINYANADMVGHSGDFQATVKAIECLDAQLGIVYDILVDEMGGTLYITADHGKAEHMYDQKMGQPYTAHTNNRVPFVIVGRQGHVNQLALHQLADIAPFILKQMGIGVPVQMKK